MKRLNIFFDLCKFLWKQRLFWLFPLILLLIILVFLMFFIESSSVSAFVYTFF